jgi:predicted transcriptional regulator of viral defense system
MGKIDWLYQLAKEGKSFTFSEALSIIGGTKINLKKLLKRLEEKGYIERIEKSKYLIIPLGSEKSKYTLHEFAIGSLLVEPYAISYWSALNFYGFTEQIPLTVFIQTTTRRKKQQISIFGVEYKIVRIKNGKLFGIRKEWIEESQVYITDKEKTIIDCLDHPEYSGGIVEVAKGLMHLKELDSGKIIKYADMIHNSGVKRRLGYLCETLGLKIKISPPAVKNYLKLDPTMPEEGSKDNKWKLIINIDEKSLGE